MSRRANPTLVGSFVLGAIGLAVGIVVVYGSGWLEKRHTFVLDFQESLDGLSEGSPVKFRGITVGSVSRIAMRFDEAGNIQTPVYIELTEGQIEGAGPEIDNPEEFIVLYVDRGLKGQLKSQSFVTGQLAVELVMRPEVPIRLVNPDPLYTEIPTARSAFAEFTQSLERIRLDDFIANLNDMLTHVRTVIDTLPLGSTLDSMQLAVSDLRRVLTNFDRYGGDLTGSADETLAAIRRAADRTEPLMAEAEQLLARTRDTEGPVTDQLMATLDEVGRMARSLRVLADFLERNPSALLFGKGKPTESEGSNP